MKEHGHRYCCERFRDSVKEGKLVHSLSLDETEWFMPEWLHIYYCPFCGTSVKGRGFGMFDKEKKGVRYQKGSYRRPTGL